MKILKAEDNTEVKVLLFNGINAATGDDEEIVFVEGSITKDIFSKTQAAGKFAKGSDEGTVIYHQRSVAGADVDITNIPKHSGKTEEEKEAEKAQKESVSKAGKETSPKAAKKAAKKAASKK